MAEQTASRSGGREQTNGSEADTYKEPDYPVSDHKLRSPAQCQRRSPLASRSCLCLLRFSACHTVRALPLTDALYRRQHSFAAIDAFSSCFAFLPGSVARYFLMYSARISRQLAHVRTLTSSPLSLFVSWGETFVQVGRQQTDMGSQSRGSWRHLRKRY